MLAIGSLAVMLLILALSGIVWLAWPKSHQLSPEQVTFGIVTAKQCESHPPPFIYPMGISETVPGPVLLWPPCERWLVTVDGSNRLGEKITESIAVGKERWESIEIGDGYQLTSDGLQVFESRVRLAVSS